MKRSSYLSPARPQEHLCYRLSSAKLSHPLTLHFPRLQNFALGLLAKIGVQALAVLWVSPIAFVLRFGHPHRNPSCFRAGIQRHIPPALATNAACRISSTHSPLIRKSEFGVGRQK